MVWLFQPQGLAHHSGLFVSHQSVSAVFQPQGLAHHSGLFVCLQSVSGVAISTTRLGSPFWPLCVPSGCKCYCMLMKYLLSNIISLTGCMYFIFQYHIVTLTWCCDMHSWCVHPILFFLNFLKFQSHVESMLFFQQHL